MSLLTLNLFMHARFWCSKRRLRLLETNKQKQKVQSGSWGGVYFLFLCFNETTLANTPLVIDAGGTLHVSPATLTVGASYVGRFRGRAAVVGYPKHVIGIFLFIFCLITSFVPSVSSG